MSSLLARLTLFSLALYLSGCYFAAGKIMDLPAYSHSEGDKTVLMLPMRDGVKLYTEVYYPEGTGPWPVILIRNPYNFPGGFSFLSRLFTRYGYVGVNQLTRGRASSEGEWMPFFAERSDGLDTLQWLTTQPWQNGNIGLFGASYLSMVHWSMADALPPEVKTMVPLVWGTNMKSIAYESGMFRHEVVTAWAALMHDKSMDNLNMRNFHKSIAHRPHIEVDELYFGGKLSWYRDWIMSASGDAPLWQLDDNKRMMAMPGQTKIPVLSVGGWYDIFITAQLDDFSRLASKDKSRMIVGPWTHLVGGAGDGQKFPDADGSGPLLGKIINWFDHHLKGAPLAEWGPVEAYSIGDNQWRAYDQWPPKSKVGRLYFSDATLSTECTGGKLLGDPGAKVETVSFDYDPEHPTPSRGGSALLAFALPGWGGTPPSTRDQAGLCERDDVLTFTSTPLRSELAIAGRIRVGFDVSTDVDDTSFTAKIIDVDAAGRAVNIVDNITSLAYRNGATMPVETRPGEIVTIVLEMSPMQWRIPRGHRIRVDISSANFPAFHAHPNYAGVWALQTKTRIAKQTLHFGPKHPGILEIPVLAEEPKTRLVGASPSP